MPSPLRANSPARNHALSIHRPEGETPSALPRNVGHPVWEINGFRAFIVIWTPEAWMREKDKPADAQAYPDGTRAALRMA
jgi:hypothetical protein